jgi:hypothetical protein
MKLQQAIEMALLAQGAAHAPSSHHHAVMSPHMKKMGGRLRPSVGKEHVGHSGGGGHHPRTTMSIRHIHTHPIRQPRFPRMRADSSASDEVQMLHPRTKKVLDRIRKRNQDPYQALKASQVTGPCGCTLQIGERVTVDGVGRGKILSRNERMLKVGLDSGVSRTIDQKFVHRML